MRKSDSIAALAGALAKAQGMMKAALKESENKFFNSKYANLAAVWEACREPLSQNGLAVIQLPYSTFDESGEHLFIETVLAHETGEWVSEAFEIPCTGVDKGGQEKFNAQTVVAAITYGRRAGLGAISGVYAGDDDDGETAVGRGQFDETKAVAPRKVKPRQKPGEPAPPPDSTPQHIALLRQEFKNYCQQRSKRENRDLAGILAEEKHYMFERFGIKSAEDCNEQQASELIDYFTSEIDKMEGR